MNSGRKPLKTPSIIDAEATLDQPAFANGMMVMRDDAASTEESVRADIFRIGQMVGARQMNQLAVKFLRAADISIFDEICKSKSYKHLPIKFPDGTVRPADNVQEFCKVFFGTSYSVLAESRQAIEVLGSESYEIAKSLGLKRTQLRLLINLPEDTRSAVEEAMQAGDKSEVVTLIQSLANQLDESKAKQEELRAEITAKEGVLRTRNERIDRLEEKLERIKILPPDEVLEGLHQEATTQLNNTLCYLRGHFRQAILAIVEHNGAKGGDSAAFVAGLVGNLQSELTILRDELLINDITRAMLPEYLTDPCFNTFAPDAAAPLKN